MRNSIEVQIDDGGFEPLRAHESDAGLDLRTPIDFTIKAWSSYGVDTKVHVLLHDGTYGKICTKSGLNAKYGITTDGTIDQGYTGPIKVILHNFSYKDKTFKRGDKIAQLVIHRIERPSVEVVNELSEKNTDRGDKGFGSTGR